jgi:O-antigen/teichoic acid export membrane protein
MNETAKSFFKKIYYSVSANFLNLTISLIVSFIVPKFLGIEQYGYWQLYLFYVSYVGFFHFGLADGVYLRYGGKYYDDLDKSLMHTQYWLLFILENLILLFIAWSAYIIKDPNKSIIFIGVGLNCILLLPRTFLQFILQGTGRIKDYARNFIIGRFSYILLILVFIMLGNKNFKYLILADIISKIIALLGLVFICKDIVFTKGVKFSSGLQEFLVNISAGSKLMFANIAGMLIIGIVRFGIERNWDVTTFGKVSFSLSISNLILTFIAAISVVIFPVLKRENSDNLPIMYETMGTLLSLIMLVFLISYYPILKVLRFWLPHYYEAIQYLAILFPISVFEARTSLLLNTYLKALREESTMLMINGFSVLLSLILTVVVTVLLGDLTLAIMSIVVLQIIKCIIPDIFLQKKLDMKHTYEVIWDVLGAIVFIFGNWFIGDLKGWVLYIGFIVFMITIRRNEFLQHFIRAKGLLI